MANQTATFEGPNAASDAAALAAKHGAEVDHTGVLFTVTYDDAARTTTAADTDAANPSVAAAIAAAKSKRA